MSNKQNNFHWDLEEINDEDVKEFWDEYSRQVLGYTDEDEDEDENNSNDGDAKENKPNNPPTNKGTHQDEVASESDFDKFFRKQKEDAIRRYGPNGTDVGPSSLV